MKKYEPTYGLDEAAEKLGKRINSLLCDALNGDLVLSVDLSGLDGVSVEHGAVEPSESDEMSDRIEYKGSPEFCGATGVWDIYVNEPCRVEIVGGNDLQADAWGMHLLADDGSVVRLLDKAGRPLRRLPDGARWVIRERNFPVNHTVIRTQFDRLADCAGKSDGESNRSAIVSRIHIIKRRKNILDSVIEMAIAAAANPNDWQSIWAALVKMADSDQKPAPLIGYVDQEGVKYQDEKGTNGVSFLVKDAFRKRMKRTSAR